MVTYGRSFTWDNTTISTDGHETPNEATQRLAHLIIISGYKPPKWNEFGRWGEKKTAPDLRAAIENQISLIGDN